MKGGREGGRRERGWEGGRRRDEKRERGKKGEQEGVREGGGVKFM